MLIKLNWVIHFVKHDINFIDFRVDFWKTFDLQSPIFILT